MSTINQFFCGHDGDAVELTNVATSNWTNPQDWLFDAFGRCRSDAGVTVNGYTALTHCPLWQGINIIAGDIGQTPLRLVRDKFYDQQQHVAWKLLQLAPNDLQTPSTFLETLVQWALMWGQGCSWIQFRGSQPYKLIPLRPDCLWKELVTFGEQEILLYHYYSPTRDGEQYVFAPWEIIDIPGLTSDGICGYELFRVAKNTIGQGLAVEKHGNSTFANGAVPGGVLEAPVGGAISRDAKARANLREEWDAVHRGPDKAGSIAILWEGITYKATSQSNIDAQWIEAKKVSVYEAAALLNLPPHKLGAMEDSSVRANLEEQNADYVQRSLRRWYNKMSEEFQRKLLTTAEWMGGRLKFIWDDGAFLKADVETATQIADRNIKATVWSPNEGRAYLGFPPRDGGDVYGSPAINPNPQRPEDGQESPDNGRPRAKADDEGLKTAHFELLRDRLAAFFETESRNLRQVASAKGSNFVEWLDSFYGSNGTPSKLMGHFEFICGKSAKVAGLAGLNVENLPGIVNSWALERRRALLEASSHVTVPELATAVEAFVTCPADERADAILRELGNRK